MLKVKQFLLGRVGIHILGATCTLLTHTRYIATQRMFAFWINAIDSEAGVVTVIWEHPQRLCRSGSWSGLEAWVLECN